MPLDLYKKDSWYLPNKDDILVSQVSEQGYQSEQRNKIINLLRSKGCQFRHCLDIGAHIGLWSRPLLDHFKKITAFEPIDVLRSCYVKNVSQDRVTLHPVALGNYSGIVKLNHNEKDSGGTHISDNGNTEVKIEMLDNFNLQDVDYIKMDVEGYELEVLKGATNLLAKQSPIIHLEMKKGNLSRRNLDKDQIRDWLRKQGYKQILKVKSEFIFNKE